MKCTFTVVVGHCSLQSCPNVSLCSGTSSIPATPESATGTDFLELFVGWSVIVPKFQDETHITVISFLEIRNHKVPNQKNEEGEGSWLPF